MNHILLIFQVESHFNSNMFSQNKTKCEKSFKWYEYIFRILFPIHLNISPKAVPSRQFVDSG